MRFLDGVRLALSQIWNQKLKSFFALIGVLIGAMFLIAVVSMVEGLNAYMEEDFARTIYGLNTLTVSRWPSVNFNPSPDEIREWRRRPRLTFDDADAIRGRLRTPALVAVESSSGGELRSADGTEVQNVWLSSVSAEFFRIRNYEVTRGRLFTAAEDRAGARVIVLGHEAAEKLFAARDPLGRTVRVRGEPFRVIGVLERQGSLFGFSLDNRVVAPARSPMARLVNPPRIVDDILVRTESPQALEQVAGEVEAIMRSRHGLRPREANDFEMDTAEDSMSFWTRISTILRVAFPFLLVISLVVAGLVIMNIMLVSVAERTREIGVRLALGAKKRDILSQVLIEATVLSATGAAMGIALGLGMARIVAMVSPIPSAVAPYWIAFAAGVGITVGVLAGLYPAWRASQLDPVVALRAE